jgi:hypothetical protein
VPVSFPLLLQFLSLTVLTLMMSPASSLACIYSLYFKSPPMVRQFRIWPLSHLRYCSKCSVPSCSCISTFLSSNLICCLWTESETAESLSLWADLLDIRAKLWSLPTRFPWPEGCMCTKRLLSWFFQERACYSIWAIWPYRTQSRCPFCLLNAES